MPIMLEILAKNNIKATFFIGGSWAKRYPAALVDIAGKGHEIGNHIYSHPQQILEAETLIKELTGVKTKLYAPPYGEYNNTVLAVGAEYFFFGH